MLQAKIHHSNFYDIDVPRDSKGRINIVIGYDWVPYNEITRKELKRMYCADWYCPDETPNKRTDNGRGGWTNEYNTKPLLIADLSCIKYIHADNDN